MAIPHWLNRVRARTLNIRFLRLLTVRAHGQYNHRYVKHSRKRILLEEHYFSISFIAFSQPTLHLNRHLIQFMFHFPHGSRVNNIE